MPRMTRVVMTMALLGGVALLVAAQDPPSSERRPAADEREAKSAPAAAASDPDGLVRLSKDYELWIDRKQKQVVVGGQVCLREGALEMFACPKNTKEHESVVSVNAPAKFVHASLLAVGARPGNPVSYDPEYKAASGTVVDIDVVWRDAEGKQKRQSAQEWIKHIRTGRKMSYDWVFAGSGFWTDDATGERYYHAEGGELVCVSNFPTAMLDLPVQSSQDNAGLLFAAHTENIPPLGTPVKLVLKPRLTNKKSAESGQDTAASPTKKDKD